MLGPRHNFPHCHWHHLSFVIVHPVPHHHCQQTYPHSTIITYQSQDFFCNVPMPRFLGKFPHPLPCYARTCCVDRVLLASSLNEVSFVFVHQLDFVFRFVNFYFKNVHSCIYVFVWFSPRFFILSCYYDHPPNHSFASLTVVQAPIVWQMCCGLLLDIRRVSFSVCILPRHFFLVQKDAVVICNSLIYRRKKKKHYFLCIPYSVWIPFEPFSVKFRLTAHCLIR